MITQNIIKPDSNLQNGNTRLVTLHRTDKVRFVQVIDIGLVNYSAFRLSELLEKKTDLKFNKVLLTFFNVFYIHFKVDKEYKKTEIVE